MRLISNLLLLLASCSAPASHWTSESIAAGDSQFDLSRYTFRTSELGLELVKMGGEVKAFLTLTHYRFSGKPITLIFPDETLEEKPLLHQGKMRISLSPHLTERLIQALQRREKVSILVDDFEETLDPFAGDL